MVTTASTLAFPMVRTPEMSAPDELVWVLGEAYRRSRQLIEQVVRDQGITATQLSILTRLEYLPGISRVELARQAFISPQAAQVALTTLENKGLVARRSKNGNSRAVGTHLTAKGRRVLEACHEATEPVMDRFAAPLAPDERRLLIELLTRCLGGPPDWFQSASG
jgi:DNA-binding MarR family transcriptional regulator